MRLSTFIGTALLAASTLAFAQAPAPAPSGKGDDGVRKERLERKKERVERKKEHREKLRAAHAKAREACKGQEGDALRACMRKEMCAQSADPAKCEARAQAGAERRAKAREACKDKPEGERRACMREQLRRG